MTNLSFFRKVLVARLRGLNCEHCTRYMRFGVSTISDSGEVFEQHMESVTYSKKFVDMFIFCTSYLVLYLDLLHYANMTLLSF